MVNLHVANIGRSQLLHPEKKRDDVVSLRAVVTGPLYMVGVCCETKEVFSIVFSAETAQCTSGILVYCNWPDLKVVFHKLPAVVTDHIAHITKLLHNFYLGSCRFCRVGKIMMQPLCLRWKTGTLLPGIITDSDDVIKVNIAVRIHVVRGVV